MKKNLLALTVVGALSLGAAQAETVLYGSVRFDYQNSKNELSQGVNENGKAKRFSNLTDQGSRIGLKGGEDLGNGVQVVYHLEWGFDGMEGGSSGDGFKNRLAYVGLATEFGTFVAGRLDNPFKQTLVDGTVTDDFNSFGQTATMRAVTSQFMGGVDNTFGPGVDKNGNPILVGTGFDFMGNRIDPTTGKPNVYGETFGDYSNFGFGLDRVSNAIAYLSPNWNGFSFNAALIMDNDFPGYQNKKHADVFTFNAQYEHESGLYGKIGYIQGYTVGDHVFSSGWGVGSVTDSNRKSRAFGAQLGYRTDQIGLSLSYADAKLSNANGTSNNVDRFTRKDKAKGWDIGASYSFGDNYASTVRISYGETRYTGESFYTDGVANGERASSRIKPKDKIWAVGFEQKLSERTRVWAEYQQIKQSGNSSASYAADSSAAANYIHGNVGYGNKDNTFAIGIRHDF